MKETFGNSKFQKCKSVVYAYILTKIEDFYLTYNTTD